MSRERVERKIERLLAESEPVEPLEGLLERLQADIPPLDKIGAAHLRAALDQRRVRRLPVLWLTAASAAFMMVGGSLAFRLWEHETRLGREMPAQVEAARPKAAVADRRDKGQSGQRDRSGQVEAEAFPLSSQPEASPLVSAAPLAIPEEAPALRSAPGGVAGGAVGGMAGAPRPVPATPEASLQATAGEAATEGEAQTPAPEARDPWKTLAAPPGRLTDRINVGGNESGQQSVFVPVEAPPPPSGPPPALAEERRAPAPRAADSAKAERQQAPMTPNRGMNSVTPLPTSREADSVRAEPQEIEDSLRRSRSREGVRFEAALLPWHRRVPTRAVIGTVPGSDGERAISKEREASRKRGLAKAKPTQKGDQDRQSISTLAPGLALRFEPRAVVRARWLGEEDWRPPGGWEGLAQREAAGRTSWLEIELRPGMKAEQVVAYVRFPESDRPVRLMEMTRSWDAASWELRAGVLRSELASAIGKRGAGLSEAERAALLERARDAEAARPDDPLAREIGELLRRFEDLGIR